MRDGDALGLAGGAGRIEDVAERVGGRSALVLAQGPVVQRGELMARLVENELGDSAVGEEIGKPQMRGDKRGVGVGEDVLNAVERIIDVERNINRPRLQEREQRDVALEPTVEQRRDAIARPDALVNEKARHLIGARVELAIGDVRALDRDGGPVGVASASLLDARRRAARRSASGAWTHRSTPTRATARERGAAPGGPRLPRDQAPREPRRQYREKRRLISRREWAQA